MAVPLEPWPVEIVPDITVHMNNMVSIPFVVSDVNSTSKLIPNSDTDIATTSIHLLERNETSINGTLNITGVFLGRTKLIFTLMENGVSG